MCYLLQIISLGQSPLINNILTVHVTMPKWGLIIDNCGCRNIPITLVCLSPLFTPMLAHSESSDSHLSKATNCLWADQWSTPKPSEPPTTLSWRPPCDCSALKSLTVYQWIKTKLSCIHSALPAEPSLFLLAKYFLCVNSWKVPPAGSSTCLSSQIQDDEMPKLISCALSSRLWTSTWDGGWRQQLELL